MSIITTETTTTLVTPPLIRPSLTGHLQIARVDHWVKNVFILPGVVVALAANPALLSIHLLWPIVLGVFATCLVASSNYVLNEVLDAPFDRKHPIKSSRPVPSGQVNIPLAYAQWIALGVLGVGLGFLVAKQLALVLTVLWVMGCIYNIPPVRSKDVPYLDVLSEAVNNPLRMLAGWYMVSSTSVIPVSLLCSYWMVGCYFMAIKRFAEFRQINDPAAAAAYRRSFAFYNEQRLLVSITFYGSAAMLFLGAFTMRYKMEMILAFPLVSLVMAVYFSIAFRENSAAQAPERLAKEPLLMTAVITCAIVLSLLLFVRIPWLYEFFAPTLHTVR